MGFLEKLAGFAAVSIGARLAKEGFEDKSMVAGTLKMAAGGMVADAGLDKLRKEFDREGLLGMRPQQPVQQYAEYTIEPMYVEPASLMHSVPVERTPPRSMEYRSVPQHGSTVSGPAKGNSESRPARSSRPAPAKRPDQPWTRMDSLLSGDSSD
jgi:hypothetical protein